MPYYEFKCESCGKEFEVKKSVNDNSEVLCPDCSSDKVQKKVSRSSFQLKGGGWAADGY